MEACKEQPKEGCDRLMELAKKLAEIEKNRDYYKDQAVGLASENRAKDYDKKATEQRHYDEMNSIDRTTVLGFLRIVMLFWLLLSMALIAWPLFECIRGHMVLEFAWKPFSVGLALLAMLLVFSLTQLSKAGES